MQSSCYVSAVTSQVASVAQGLCRVDHTYTYTHTLLELLELLELLQLLGLLELLELLSFSSF